MNTLKNITLPKPLLDFIESAEQRLLADEDTYRVEFGVELVWTDMIWPSYTTVTIYAFGSGNLSWIERCMEFKCKLNDTKPESLFDYVRGPYITIQCCLENRPRPVGLAS